jgi:hypothetical protein
MEDVADDQHPGRTPLVEGSSAPVTGVAGHRSIAPHDSRYVRPTSVRWPDHLWIVSELFVYETATSPWSLT